MAICLEEISTVVLSIGGVSEHRFTARAAIIVATRSKISVIFGIECFLVTAVIAVATITLIIIIIITITIMYMAIMIH
jgi:hypothetical protein